ncbi:glycosyltransferase [Winogradskyella sp. A3E31]|uniref:glycosyltransferase n=1 Tax=Winogradskyella sp. A3E31 TaxID=3349637 RepID=UPI00398AD101
MKLLIISHTEHYKTVDGDIVGWGPTVTEINHLTQIFDAIEHIAMLKEGAAPPSALAYRSNNIQFTPIPSVGGSGFRDKVNILLNAPQTLKIIRKALKRTDVFQFRAPTGIGVYVIPYLVLYTKTKGWFKYAGNWNQKQPPLGYCLQRWLLKRQSRTVTINGHWPNQPKHCLSFENPCLTSKDVEAGAYSAQQKSWDEDIELCYVGRLESPKGVGRIIDSLKHLDATVAHKIKRLHLIGDGPERTHFEALAKKISIPVQFYGFLPRQEVFDIYKRCHYFVMPTTASEGFPKVIAEAYNFGCIPIVSNISAIGHYMKHKATGYLLETPTAECLALTLSACLSEDPITHKEILDKRHTFVKAFSFSHYNERITNDILKP